MALNVSDCYADHKQNIICMPVIKYAESLLENCEVMGVIGYEIAKRKKDGPNAEPIIILRKEQGGPTGGPTGTPLEQLMR